MKIRASVVNFEVHPITEASEFWAHLTHFIDQAAGAGDDLLVFPELPVLELCALKPDLRDRQIPPYLAEFAPRYEAFLQAASDRHDLMICGGSHIDADGRNVAYFAWPGASGTYHPKNVMTQWESVEWGLSGYDGLPVCRDEKLGVTICYDSEFPEAGRILAERGVLVQVVPAYTEKLRGFQRVRWSCQARAIENQIFVLHASLVGAFGREPVVSTYGTSAILTPSVAGFPDSAVLAETPLAVDALARAELDLDLLLASREGDDVRNWHDRHASTWGCGSA